MIATPQLFNSLAATTIYISLPPCYKNKVITLTKAYIQFNIYEIN